MDVFSSLCKWFLGDAFLARILFVLRQVAVKIKSFNEGSLLAFYHGNLMGTLKFPLPWASWYLKNGDLEIQKNPAKNWVNPLVFGGSDDIDLMSIFGEEVSRLPAKNPDNFGPWTQHDITWYHLPEMDFGIFPLSSTLSLVNYQEIIHSPWN